MGWESFKSEYKLALNNGEDMGYVIANSYDKAMTGAVPPEALMIEELDSVVDKETRDKVIPQLEDYLTAMNLSSDDELFGLVSGLKTAEDDDIVDRRDELISKLKESVPNPALFLLYGTQKGQGSATIPGIILSSPEDDNGVKTKVKLMASLLNMCLKSPLPFPPFSLALDNALKLYWIGAISTNLCMVVNPGVTAAYIEPEGMKNKSVDDFLDQLIKSFKNHLNQVQGIGIPLGTIPTVWTGYKVPD